MGTLGDDLANALTERDAEPAGDSRIPEPGSRIGRFVVDEVLGTGGMGVVVSAWDPNLKRDVALKLLRPSRGDDSEARARLLREARAMAGVRHPNVLTVYEAGTHGDRIYVAMERIEGGTLRDLSSRVPRPDWRDTVRSYVAAGEGLYAAHRAGLVHRDFKPDNVLVDGARVLVADFGLVSTARDPAGARLADEKTSMPEDIDSPLTAADMVVGTPAYMAPEQHGGEPCDARSDLSWLIDYRLSYAAMLGIDLACLAAIGGYALVHRPDFVRGSFNRRVTAFGATAVLATLVLVLGGSAAGFAPAVTATLHLFTTFCFAAGATILLDRRLIVIALGYALAFFAAAARSDLFFRVSFASHGLMAVTLYLVLDDNRGRARRAGDDLDAGDQDRAARKR